MVVFPNAKINLGLNVAERRPDGYHNLETVFYPVGLCDVLEVLPGDAFEFSSSGIVIDSDTDNNLVVKAFRLLEGEFGLPPVRIHLHKVIPLGAGLGGGSSDAAWMLKVLSQMFRLNLDRQRLIRYAATLGADCPFFIDNQPAYASGIGDILTPEEVSLDKFSLVIVKPPVSVNTGWAYRSIQPCRSAIPVRECVGMPVETWQGKLVNDFEIPVFQRFPEIEAIRDQLYDMGALYASMSGSGSSVYGIFGGKSPGLRLKFPGDYFVFCQEHRT